MSEKTMFWKITNNNYYSVQIIKEMDDIAKKIVVLSEHLVFRAVIVVLLEWGDRLHFGLLSWKRIKVDLNENSPININKLTSRVIQS